MIDRWKIPTFEPEVIEARARRFYRGDNEKVATTSIKELTVNGVRITSRYGKASELALMATVVSEMPAEECSEVKEVFCDSKACATYMLTTTSRSAAQSFANGVTKHSGGYNGIFTDDNDLYFDPYWPGDESW